MACNTSGTGHTHPEDVMNAHLHRPIAAALLALTALTLAVPAFADRDRRYKGDDGPRPVFVERSSGAGPALAGLVGGFILGNAFASSSRTVIVHSHRRCERPVVVFRYRDPYCDTWYDSLDECSFRHHHHPRIVQVIDVRTGDEVRRLRLHGRDWRDDEDDDEDFDD